MRLSLVGGYVAVVAGCGGRENSFDYHLPTDVPPTAGGAGGSGGRGGSGGSGALAGVGGGAITGNNGGSGGAGGAASSDGPPPGSILWLKADVGVTKDAAGNVSDWADQSGHNNDATLAPQCTKMVWQDNALNTWPALYGTYTTGMVARTITGDMSTFTLSFVIKPDRLRDWDNAFAASGGWGWFQFHGSANGAVYSGTTAVSRIQTRAGVMLVDKTQSFTYWFDNGSARLYKNGKLESSAVLTKGQSWPGFVFFQIEGLLPEIVLYDRALADAGVQQVHAYLDNKYAVY